MALQDGNMVFGLRTLVTVVVALAYRVEPSVE